MSTNHTTTVNDNGAVVVAAGLSAAVDELVESTLDTGDKAKSLLSRVATALRNAYQQRKTERLLRSLSDEQLADIGLDRSDIYTAARESVATYYSY